MSRVLCQQREEGADSLVVVFIGDSGLPRVPAANTIFVNEKGEIEGLF